MDDNKKGIQRGRLDLQELFRALGIALLSAGAFSVLILFSWNHVMPAIFHLPAMRFKEALGATGLLFSTGFLLNSRWTRTQDSGVTTQPK
jgi:hypothetical protein